MVGLGSAIAGGVTALGSAIYGAVTSAKANKKARELISQQRADNKDWYNRKMAEDYTQRSDAQAVLSKQRELLNERYRQAQATNVVAGGTDESLALQQQAANKAMAQTMSDIAANASAYKDSVEQSYRNQDAALNQQQIANYSQQAQAAAAAAGQAVGAGVNLVGTGISGTGAKKASTVLGQTDGDVSQVLKSNA